jgi:hypothetical protein
MRVIIMILLLADLCVHDLTNLSGEEHGITPRDKHDNAEVLNVCYKRVTRTSERRTPPTLRTSPISIYNGSTQRYSITLK